ncbi:hypothetical protein [Paraburkholderia dilworthii]|uniref:MalT-like winged helix domain-containing protein n=1 Tax=Paraburkholderia dilworthii TaxID=948106 RepID=A0ABW9D7D5_9BURK
MGDAAKVASNLAGSGSGIDRYLDDTVLVHLPPPILKFLMHTSILERLAPAVCDAILGDGHGSAAKLDWLEEHNVFIRPLDERQEWYRYYALLSDALRRRLIRPVPQQVPLLHRRASQWFAGARLWPEAVQHALAAGDLEQAAQWVENCAMEMIEREDPYTVLAWIGKLPPDVVLGRRRLRLAKAWTLALALALALQRYRRLTYRGRFDRIRRIWSTSNGQGQETACSDILRDKPIDVNQNRRPSYACRPWRSEPRRAGEARTDRSACEHIARPLRPMKRSRYVD